LAAAAGETEGHTGYKNFAIHGIVREEMVVNIARLAQNPPDTHRAWQR